LELEKSCISQCEGSAGMGANLRWKHLSSLSESKQLLSEVLWETEVPTFSFSLKLTASIAMLPYQKLPCGPGGTALKPAHLK
jgi:hypothetical protein